MISAVVLLVVAITVDLCDQCCMAYQCSDYKSSGKCSGGNDWDTGYPCLWENNACRKGRCGDVTSISVCDSYQPDCQWNSTDCVEVNSCAAWSGSYISDCLGQGYGNTPCVADGQTCKSATCADLGVLGRYACEKAGMQCKYNADSSTCTAASSCSDWNNDITNCQHSFGNSTCSVVGAECKVATCADYSSSESNCEMRGCKYLGGSCTNVSSCSGWSDTDPTTCLSKSYNGTRCLWESNACRSYTCGDFDGSKDLCESGSGSTVDYCKWKDNKCVYVETSCEAESDSYCDMRPRCTYLSGACPSPSWEETPSSSFRTIVPTTVVALALIFSLLW